MSDASMRAWIPSMLLVGVALVHFYHVKWNDLTQWKGGGFGMFSTVDAGGLRKLSIYGSSGEQRYMIRLPGEYSKERRLVSRLPSRENLGRLAEELGKEVWCCPASDYVGRVVKRRFIAGHPLARGPLYGAHDIRDPQLVKFRPGVDVTSSIVSLDSVSMTVSYASFDAIRSELSFDILASFKGEVEGTPEITEGMVVRDNTVQRSSAR